MASDCGNFEKNMSMCTCSYAGCPKHAKCCECLHSHRRQGQLPACYFPPEVEKTYDRSIAKFVEINS